MSYQVHTIYNDSEEFENVESLGEANKLIKRNKGCGAKESSAILYKGKAPEPWVKMNLNRALKTGTIGTLLKQAASDDQGASLYAQEALRKLFAKEPTSDYETVGLFADVHDKVAAAVYTKTALPLGLAEPQDAGDPSLVDTTGPAFRQQTQVGQGAFESGEGGDKGPFSTDAVTQDDMNGFLDWIAGLDRDAVERQGWSNADLFRRYMESTKPRVLRFGEDPLKSLGMAAGPGSIDAYNNLIEPKGGSANQ